MQNILFVDDESHVLKSLERILRVEQASWGFEGVTSASDALHRIKQGGIDIVVADIRMPGMDGIELLSRLKANPETEHIPVLMLTGINDFGLKNVSLELGAIDFLNKPIDPDDLVARLRNVFHMLSYRDQLKKQNRMLEEQLIQSQKMEIVGLLAAGVVHDLNNILSSILGNTQMAMLKAEDANLQKNLKRIFDSTNHAGRLVKQILKLGKPSRPDSTICDLGSVVGESLELVTATISDRITVEWESEERRHWIGADPTAINQVLMNLFINAIDAMEGAGVLRISLRETELDAEMIARYDGVSPGEFVRLDVSDTGGGMDEATKQKVFDPFFTTKGPDRGTGLGLLVVHRTVKNLAGFITIESALGSGTTFSVYFPRAHPAETVSRENESKQEVAR